MTDYHLRDHHTTTVLSDVLAELRIARDSTKGSLAEQVAHELRTRASRSSGEDTADKIDAERWRWVRGRLTIREEEMMSGRKAECLDIRLGASRVDRVPHFRPEVDPLLEEAIDAARRGKEGT